METIRRGSENMSRLVNDLLNLAHVGRQELKREPTPLNPLIDEVIIDLKRETEGRNIEWRMRSCPPSKATPACSNRFSPTCFPTP